MSQKDWRRLLQSYYLQCQCQHCLDSITDLQASSPHLALYLQSLGLCTSLDVHILAPYLYLFWWQCKENNVDAIWNVFIEIWVRLMLCTAVTVSPLLIPGAVQLLIYTHFCLLELKILLRSLPSVRPTSPCQLNGLIILSKTSENSKTPNSKRNGRMLLFVVSVDVIWSSKVYWLTINIPLACT